jgi:hypothetical protein
MSKKEAQNGAWTPDSITLPDHTVVPWSEACLAQRQDWLEEHNHPDSCPNGTPDRGARKKQRKKQRRSANHRP